MPYGYTNCKFCGKQIPSRRLKLHLQTCNACPEGLRPDYVTPKPKVYEIEPEKQKPTTNPFTQDKKYTYGGTENRNPYTIANRFIKNQIQEGSIDLNLSKLIEDKRAEIKLVKDKITIIIDLAKFRKNLNKKFEVLD